MMISLLYLHVLGEAVDVADIPVIIVVGHVEGRQVARGSDLATRGGGGATKCHSLSTPTRWCPVDGLTRSAWITSIKARGSHPLERVDRLPRSA
jgi:hypothetical protein